MSSKHFKQTSENFEKQLNQLLLLLKSHQLSAKKKSIVDERSKRLNNDYKNVGGRKLDQESHKSTAKLFGHGTANQHVEKDRLKSCLVVKAKEKQCDEKETKNLQEQLKNFTFNFPKEKKIYSTLTVKVNSKKPQKPATEASNGGINEPIKAQASSSIAKKKENKPLTSQYQLDHMYFVLDTNVLMDSLKLLEDVANLTLFGTSGSMLYVPYIVIKELDILKCRQTTSFAARRAIEYLNDKFDDEEKIEAQSALEDAQQLIDIDSADDNIINCCLQLKAELQHMMLLTNDNNLRLKAVASSIRVSTCYQLTSYKGYWWSLPRDRRLQRRQKYKVWT